jgi:hypothetical protein
MARQDQRRHEQKREPEPELSPAILEPEADTAAAETPEADTASEPATPEPAPATPEPAPAATEPAPAAATPAFREPTLEERINTIANGIREAEAWIEEARQEQSRLIALASARPVSVMDHAARARAVTRQLRQAGGAASAGRVAKPRRKPIPAHPTPK